MGNEMQISEKQVDGRYVAVQSYPFADFQQLIELLIADTFGDPALEICLRSILSRKECIITSDSIGQIREFVSRFLITCIEDFNEGECSQALLENVLSFYKLLLNERELSFYRVGDAE